MENDIKSKLANELVKPIDSEIQVVYILTRVRKLLEIKEKKEQYQFLNFYCNWALHAKIDKVGKKVEEFLKQVASGDNTAGGDHIYFSFFHQEFKLFLKEFDLPTNIYDNSNPPSAKGIFNRLLAQIYSDTPLVLKTTTEKRITFSNVKGKGGSYGLLLSVDSLD